jgi:putative DNA primase/helicase
MFLYGTGANGKSVVQYVVQSILGDDYCSNYELSQLCTSNDAGYNLADANGKLLNFAADMGDRDFSGGRFKAISAREPIQVRPIGQEPYKASDMPLMISNINKIPQTSDATDGYWRRFKLIHFPVTIAEDMQDKTLKPRLRMELSGIFNWILEGRARIVKQAGHFTHSDYMDKMVGRARKESNSLLSFLEENRYVPIKEVGKTYTEVPVLSRDLMKQYKDYCLVWGNMPKSKKSFLDELRAAGFEYSPVMHTPSGTSTGWRLWKVDLDFGEEFADDIPMRIEDVNPELPF